MPSVARRLVVRQSRHGAWYKRVYMWFLVIRGSRDVWIWWFRRWQAHCHCCLTWIFSVKWNIRDLSPTAGAHESVTICIPTPSKNGEFEALQSSLSFNVKVRSFWNVQEHSLILARLISWPGLLLFKLACTPSCTRLSLKWQFFRSVWTRFLSLWLA